MGFLDKVLGRKNEEAGKIARAANSAAPLRETAAQPWDNSLEERLIDWLDKVLEQDVPAEVKAFCFNLYEGDAGEWSLELVGTERFDMEDEDWACDEVTDFGTRDNPFTWEEAAGWERVLAEIRDILWYYVADNHAGKYADKLADRAGVGVGFVDGNIEIISHRM